MTGAFTYKQKSMALVAGFLVFMCLAYQLSFKKTINLNGEISAKEQKLAWLKEKEKELPFLKSKMSLVESSYNRDSLSIRDQLTSYISDFAENNSCLVTEIPYISVYKNNNLVVQTNQFTVKGSFNPLLQLIQQLESRFRSSAKLMSLHFSTIKDFQSKKKSLYLTLTTQSFSQNHGSEKHD